MCVFNRTLNRLQNGSLKHQIGGKVEQKETDTRNTQQSITLDTRLISLGIRYVQELLNRGRRTDSNKTMDSKISSERQ